MSLLKKITKCQKYQKQSFIYVWYDWICTKSKGICTIHKQKKSPLDPVNEFIKVLVYVIKYKNYTQVNNKHSIYSNILISFGIHQKKASKARCWWLTPIILATQEAKIRRVVFQSQHRLIV
jgi:hypothetical protein